jgi:predicted HicB family RNase H-like nuclease
MANKLVGFRIDEKLHRKLKIIAAERDASIQELLTRAITAYLTGLPKVSRNAKGKRGATAL